MALKLNKTLFPALLWTMVAGVRIPLKRGNSIGISHVYHENTLNKALDGVCSCSGWAGGPALERSYWPPGLHS